MVGGQDQVGGPGCRAVQGESQQRGPRGVEAVALFFGEQVGGRGLAGEVDHPPRHPRAFGDDLHRIAVGGCGEGDPQRRVPVEDALRGAAQPVGVDRSAQFDVQLQQVGVGFVGGDLGQVQQAALQR